MGPPLSFAFPGKFDFDRHQTVKKSGDRRMKGGTTTSWTTTSVRRSGYKAVVDGVGGRRRREEDMVEIRKAKREESLLKKRREALPLPHSPPLSDAVSLDQNVRFCLFNLSYNEKPGD